MVYELNGFSKRPLCPFCSAEWTDDMIDAELESECYDSGCSTEATIKITCSSCDKLIYQKDGFF